MRSAAFISRAQVQYVQSDTVVRLSFSRIFRFFAFIGLMFVICLGKISTLYLGNISIVESRVAGALANRLGIKLVVVSDFFLTDIESLIDFADAYAVDGVVILELIELFEQLRSRRPELNIRYLTSSGRFILKNVPVISIKPIFQFGAGYWLRIIKFYKRVGNIDMLYVTFHPRVGIVERFLICRYLKCRSKLKVIVAQEYSFERCCFMGFYSSFMIPSRGCNSFELIDFNGSVAFEKFVRVLDDL